MKVIKPQRLGVLQRVVQHRRRCHLVVSVLVYVPFRAPKGILPEIALWKDAAETIPGGVVDEGYAKPRADVLVSGKAFGLAGASVGVAKVRCAVAREGRTLVDKTLAVFGDRYWKGEKPTEPLPFVEMPISWGRAFGGEGFASNPVGKGIRPIATEHGPLHPLPNVEDPKCLIVGPKDRPAPAGLGPIDLTWEPRISKVGKRYGGAWLQDLAPGPAEDFDAGFYNAAPADQQLAEGFFSGAEEIAIEGMHPSERRVELALAPMSVRVLATLRDPEGGERFAAHETRLDTIHLLPCLERAICIHRAVIEVRDDDADDVVHLIVAAEDPEEPKPVSHYADVLALRLDKERGALASLRDEDLMPPAAKGWTAKADYGDMVQLTRTEQRGLQKAERGRKVKLAEARRELEAAGFDVGSAFDEPDLPTVADPYDVDELERITTEIEARSKILQEEAERRSEAMKAEARASFAEMGLDYDEECRKAQEQAGGPPTFSAEQHLIMLHDMARLSAEGGEPMVELENDLIDPRYEEMLHELEARVRQSYVQMAHFMPCAALPPEDKRQHLRALVQIAMDAGEPLAGRDLTGADLHGLHLRGMDFSGALLERADLSDADLSGARLCEAVLTRADLTRTDLSGADLSGANLGDTALVETDLTEASLDEAVLMRARLARVKLFGASLRGVELLETTLEGVDFTGATLEAPLFLKMDLRGASFVGAVMRQARFVEVDLRGVDFTGADLEKAQLVQCDGEGACFASARLDGIVIAHESSFPHATFTGASMRKAGLRKTPLTEADFADAQLDGADLSGCDLRRANLRRARFRQGMAIRADLRGANLRGFDGLGALMSKARLEGADLSGSNLARGDLSLVRLDAGTKIEDALLLDTRVDPKHDPKADRP
jgi:uncharacterized protein YjbI with pentapeptide repeats